MVDIVRFFAKYPTMTLCPIFNPLTTAETDKHSHTHNNLAMCMWEYLPGVKQPQTATTSSKRARHDDEADSRQFVRSYLEDFSCFFYNSSTKIMYCKLCQKHHKKNVFTTYRPKLFQCCLNVHFCHRSS